MQGPVVTFDNTNQVVAVNIVNPDLGAVWGDFVRLTRSGNLVSITFYIRCSSGSAADLTSATATISMFDYTGGAIGAQLWSQDVSIGSIAKGTYAAFTAVPATDVQIPVTDVFIRQVLSNVVGANVMGVPVTGSTATASGTQLTTGMYFQSNGAVTLNYIQSGYTINNPLYKVVLA